MERKIKKRINICNMLAALLVFLGFGMIHGSPEVERIGSLMIGLGSSYLILILLRSLNKQPKNDRQI